MLSAIMLATGSANAFLMFALYIIQRTLMSVGGVFYGWVERVCSSLFTLLVNRL